MSAAREIKARMDSVGETQKITNAMYLIASAKLRKARQELNNTRPYFDALQAEIKRIFRTAPDVDSPYFYAKDADSPREGTWGCLVVTADKGLAGSYNQNVLREAQKLLERHPDTELHVVGEYGRRYFNQRSIPIEHSFLYTAQNPTMARAREICALLLDDYETGHVSEIYIVYTDMENSTTFLPRSTRLLPFKHAHFGTAPADTPEEGSFEFLPSVQAVLDGVMRSYISGFIYSALIASFCCEQNARMMAMDSANRNAEKLLGELSLTYNQVRQSAITQEITEISAGALAQRRKREKQKKE